MDGASKFVRGDAIAGLLVLLINVIGGMVIGIMQQGLSFAEAGHAYTLLSRYPLMTFCQAGWKLASLCGECFNIKGIDGGDARNKWPRFERQCEGCGEPMATPLRKPFHHNACSLRCYQRIYRKRKRGHDSTVQWKMGVPLKCGVCKKPLNQYGKPGKRKDAQYCSSTCRQWAYRRRKVTL
jgi:hypothetical protein